MVQAISHLAGLLQAQTDTSEILMTITNTDQNECEFAVAWPNASADMELIETWQTTPLITDSKGNLLNFKDTVKSLSGGTLSPPLLDQDNLCTGGC